MDDSNMDYYKGLKMDCLEYKNPTDPARLAIGLVKPKSKVLSCGCGEGREVKFLKNIGCKVVAIERNLFILEISQEREPDAEYVLGRFSDFIRPDTFDYVLCLSNTINQTPSIAERKRFIENSYKNLKKGGKLLITTEHAFSRKGAFIRWLFFRNPRFYHPNQIDCWFKNINFRSIHKIKIGHSTLIVAEK